MNSIVINQEGLEGLKKSIKEAGSRDLHILADFDRTMTKAFVNGESTPSLISILRDGNYLTPDYAERAQALYRKYHPMEIDPDIPLTDKKKAMEEWWLTHFDLLIESKLNKKDLQKIIDSGKVEFREGALDFLDFLRENGIPLVIMSSSGLGGDVIKMYLTKEGVMSGNIHIISNSYEWDAEGFATSIKKPIIHAMNKDETMIKDFPAIFEIIENRKNVILLGDSLGDVGMIEGFEYNALIKIGFLNEAVESNLEAYKKNYDVLLLNDSPMDYVNTLLKDIMNK